MEVMCIDINTGRNIYRTLYFHTSLRFGIIQQALKKAIYTCLQLKLQQISVKFSSLS